MFHFRRDKHLHAYYFVHCHTKNSYPKLLREKKIPIEFLMMSANARYLARVSRDATELQNVMIYIMINNV